MKRKFNLQQKIILTVVGVSTIIYIIAIGFISTSAKNTAMHDAVELTISTAKKNASDMQAILEKDLVAMRILAQTVMTYKEMPEDQWKKLFLKMYENIMAENDHFLSVWDSWELNHLDPTYKKDYGRYVAEVYREGYDIKSNSSLKSLTGDSPDYARLKRLGIEAIENPYFYSYSGEEKDQFLMTSLIVPLKENNKYFGLVGIDISLQIYHPIINSIRPFEKSYAFLISNDLQYVAHPSNDKLGTSFSMEYDNILSQNNAVEKITRGEEVSFTAKDLDGEKSLFVFTPLVIGKTGTPWSLAVVVPQKTILSKANKNFFISIILGVLGLVVLTSIVIVFSQKIIKSIRLITNVLKRVAKGNIADDMKLAITTDDEIGQMTEALNTTIEGLSNKVDFAKNIGQGNLEAEFIALSEEDILGKALIDMRNSLKQAAVEEDKRAADDQRRQWANEGLAKFGEILRADNDNMENLSKAIIREIVQTLNANQGGLFLLNDDDSEDLHFDLMASFAFNRFKYKQKKILFGEGLIGACALERKTILLTEIPDNYIEITSGLGKSNPRALIIVPLMLEDKVLGVIEIASFNLFEPFQVDFLERLAQSIAASLTSVRESIKTSQLLARTQQQAEEMAAQEEEMRQNMEELQATQEEAARKSFEMNNYINAINNSAFVIEYDTKGYITFVNDKYLELLGVTREYLIGSHHSHKMEFTDEQKRNYDKFWDDLRNGIAKNVRNRFTVKDVSYIFEETYNPMRDEFDIVYKIIKIATNISQSN